MIGPHAEAPNGRRLDGSLQAHCWASMSHFREGRHGMRIDTAATGAIVAALIGIAACSPSEGDYAAALERNWPAEQMAQKGRASFFADHATSFERSAERSADIARRLGTDNALSEDANRTAENARSEEKAAAYIAAAAFVRARDISCAPASPLPGENCEATVTIRGTDGEEHDIVLARRFDERDGQIEVVGTVGN